MPGQNATPRTAPPLATASYFPVESKPMELRDAIDRIAAIRNQLASTAEPRCLHAVPVALSAALAVSTAIAQELAIDDALTEPRRFLLLWLGCAMLGGCFAATEWLRRALHSRSPLELAQLRLAARQFLPALLVGGIWTVFVATRMPQLLWLLPGCWQLLFGLANLAAQQLLPTAARWLGLWFLATGTACLWLGEAALEPWAMGLPFAAGQTLLAAALWQQQGQRARTVEELMQ